MDNNTWPEYFPQGCPPADAEKRTLDVFRLVENNPPEQNDFISAYQKNPKRKYYDHDRNLIDTPIIAYGLSCFTESEYAIKQGELLLQMPYYKKRPYVNFYTAAGVTKPECGVVKETPAKLPSHITYWICKDKSILQDFNIMKKGS